MKLTNRPVVVIGGGPVGLAAAAHLLARDLTPLVLEAGPEVGSSPRDWGHVRLFSPWRFNVDKEAVKLLAASGWEAPPPDETPTGAELARRYLQPLAELPALREHVRSGHRVIAAARRTVDKVQTASRSSAPFLVRVERSDGRWHDVEASAVLDASGTWSTPNPLAASGLPAIGEREARHLVHYGIPDVLGADRGRYAGKTTLVVGAGHSAANSILGLATLAREAPGTAIRWATRSENPTRAFGGGKGDALPARGRLGDDLRALTEQGGLVLRKGFRIEEIRRADDKLDVHGTHGGEPFVERGIDRIIAATGQRPNLDATRELRLSLDPALECVSALGPLIDPNHHSCGTVRAHGAKELAHPEPGFYTIGSKSYGRAPTFLLATGYEQARSVVAMIAGDVEAAMRVELELPETGVCHSDLESDEGACCGPKSACC